MLEVFLTVLLLCLLPSCHSDCTPDDPQFMVTFHPHLDAFWLNTDDELKNINFVPASFLYQMNQRNSKTIYNSMLAALTKDSKRKFFTTEIVFFKDWFDYITSAEKTQVTKLLHNGQLQIANGGWVQNDQAVCYFDDILDQYTIGMNYMYETFQIPVKIGWATDSFGHSHSQVALQHLLGIEAQGIERVDDRYIYRHNSEKPLLEFYWAAISDSNNRSYGGVDTYLRHFLHEVNNLRAGQTQIYIQDFRKMKNTMTKMYGKNKFFRFLGNDFEEFLTTQFQALEKTFYQLNIGSRKQCPEYKYGNPSDYMVKFNQFYARHELPVRKWDFMPNWDQGHYWTGYFTTEPDLKKLCKDFSRLLNLYRKIFLKYYDPKADLTGFKTYLRKAEQLLAVMQHHDGITATSKLKIEELFKKRIRTMTQILNQGISQLKEQNKTEVCPIYQNGQCQITKRVQTLQLVLYHEGSPKTELIELMLPVDYYYQVVGVDSDTLCMINNECNLLFEAQIKSGQNVFVLKHVPRPAQTAVYTVTDIFLGTNFSISLTDYEILYKFNNTEHISFSYHLSNARPIAVDTSSWDKYGREQQKMQMKQAGIYLMANDGKLVNLNKFGLMVGVIGKHYARVIIEGEATSKLTINLKDLVANFASYFQPIMKINVDYYLKVKSSISNNEGTFYHDMNGYLVSLRKLGYRPDYRINDGLADKLNGNTYPACSFIYVKDGIGRKFVAFVDRAQGVTFHEGALLFNLDRFTGDDGKGAAEGYTEVKLNVFRYKFAITIDQDDVQRRWQRAYDDANVAFITEKEQTAKVIATTKPSSEYFKYSLQLLNDRTLLLRLVNLAEFQEYQVGKYGENSWKIEQLGLDLKYYRIIESFANGIPLSKRIEEFKTPNDINVPNAALKDTPTSIHFEPLQIRSFRLHLEREVVKEEAVPVPLVSPIVVPSAQTIKKPEEQTNLVNTEKVKTTDTPVPTKVELTQTIKFRLLKFLRRTCE